MGAKLGLEKIAIHCFTDGRDTGPYTGKGFCEEDGKMKRWETSKP